MILESQEEPFNALRILCRRRGLDVHIFSLLQPRKQVRVVGHSPLLVLHPPFELSPISLEDERIGHKPMPTNTVDWKRFPFSGFEFWNSEQETDVQEIL
jgi:hypothetical protein